MKLLTWNNIDDVYPEHSGYYIVCTDYNAVPRIAYFDKLGLGGDWFETVSHNVLSSQMHGIMMEISLNKDVQKALGEKALSWLKSEQSEFIIEEIIEENIDTSFPNTDCLSEDVYTKFGVDVQFWCDVPKTPLTMRYDQDERVMAATEIGTQEILIAIEPVIKRILGGIKGEISGNTPPWKQEND